MLPTFDNEFGPILPGKFDFTLLFELVMLGMVPAGIVILLMPFYLGRMLLATHKVRPGPLLWFKLTAGTALIAVQLASIISWQKAGLYRSGVSLAASVMSFIASLCVVGLLYISHTFSLHQSSFLSVYLSATMLFDMAMTRSYFLRGSLDFLGALQATIAVLKFTLVVIEEIPKHHLFHSSSFRLGPAERGGFWGRALLLWVTPILRLGFVKDLSVDELPHIGDQYDSEPLFNKFVPNWNEVDRSTKLPLARACFRTLRWQFLIPILPRLCFIGCSFSRPFFMERVIDAVSTNSASSAVTNGLIGASVLIFGGLMRLTIDQLENSAAVTLMTTDMAGVQEGLGYMHSTWASLVELGLGIYALYTFVGYACFLIFIPSSIAAMGTYMVTKKMASARTAWNTKVETRVAATSNFLAQLKSIKAMGLTDAISTYLQEKRLDEIETSMIERNCRIMIYGIYGFGAAMTPVAVLAGARFWTRASRPMTVSETFAAYAAIFIAALPLNSLLGHLPYYASGYACFLRVQKFLTLPERRDQRESPERVENKAEKTEKNETVHGRPSKYAVTMNNVSVNSDFSGPILKDVTLRVPTGSLAMMHGLVSSGKSAFLKTIMGELSVNTGTLEVASKIIAYTSQTPWIRNATIKENIIGPYPFAEELYNEVVYACALDKDIADLPDGDSSMAGSNGCNLSGGQKQRLGLARSLFAQTSIVLLDNVLSALDADTAELVFKRVCGRNGLLRRWNCTAIITTNQPKLLEEADIVFEISHQGRVRQKEMNSRNNSARGVATNVREETPGPEMDVPATCEEFEPPSVDLGGQVPETNKPDQKRRHGDLSLYGYYFRTAHCLLFVTWFTVAAIAAVMERMPQIFMRIWLSTDAANDWYFAGFAALSLVETVVTCASGAQFLKQIVPKSSVELHSRLLQTVLDSTLSYLSHTDAGSLLNRFSQDISLISQQMPLMLMTTVSMFFNVLVDMGIIASGAKLTPPIIVFLVAILYGIQYFYLRTSRQLRYLELETTSPLVTHFAETSTGMAHIRGLGWQRSFDKELITRLNHSQRPFYYLLCIQQWLTLVLDLMAFITAVTLVSVTTVFPESSSDSAIGLALLNLISFSTTASYCLQMWVQLETSLGGLARIQSFCKETPVEQDREDMPALPDNWPSSGKIDFNCVTAKYTGLQGEAYNALKNTTVSIQHGQRVSISGRTGSGKTSMMLALLNLIEFSGSINIDGLSIKMIPRHVLRANITTMTQEGVELKGTIRMNTFPFALSPPTDAEIIATLERVGLWVHVRRQGGLESDMSKSHFSHGQKQLLFLARAILHQQVKQTKIILVDEATSSLDSTTDENMRQLMAEAFADCTVITIAHQRDYAAEMDLAVELDSGNLVRVLRRSLRTGAMAEHAGGGAHILTLYKLLAAQDKAMDGAWCTHHPSPTTQAWQVKGTRIGAWFGPHVVSLGAGGMCIFFESCL
ncbi:canalicular multispecific organic anion transporter 1 [Beauveria bassiana ARSEF 2860]|uniref:Canalicular multispecific organic anion transporter 1 n=1 Tax=Beauveria bassiana (strain ARSEF 2860) TaxID=655819 RepID=J4KPP1_BEAB2|nr:canalicular multispecific organic anion transporter 1 [Beauveria bassiana ARSEF 2860]EJP67794.1 canalicular multispecific organic anion transporter 1 [Beauveria bassiana ARSEF 2860]